MSKHPGKKSAGLGIVVIAKCPGMLLSLESVFGVVFSVIIYHERITLRMFAGFAVIFAAILLSQWDGKRKFREEI